MKKTLIVNFYGGPGAGKSTIAARVFSELKNMGITCELITEYAKDVTWQKGFHVLSNQLYIFAKQQHRIWRVDGQVDVILTDAPLLHSLIYGQDDSSEAFKHLVWDEYFKRPTFDIYLNRGASYDTTGRSQTLEEAQRIDRIILDTVNNFNLTVTGEFESIPQIITEVTHALSELKKYNKTNVTI